MIPTSAQGLLLVGGWDPTGTTELVRASSQDRLPLFFQSNLTTHPLSLCCCPPFTCSAFSAGKLFHLSKFPLFGLVFPFWAVQDTEGDLGFQFQYLMFKDLLRALVIVVQGILGDMVKANVLCVFCSTQMLQLGFMCTESMQRSKQLFLQHTCKINWKRSINTNKCWEKGNNWCKLDKDHTVIQWQKQDASPLPASSAQDHPFSSRILR